MPDLPRSPLPPSRRLVTTHDKDGKSVVWISDKVERKVPGAYTDGVTFGVAWTTAEHPAEVQSEVDGKDLKIGELTSKGKTAPDMWCDTGGNDC